MEYSNLFVCLMGICTVFIGLICIIILVSIMSNVVRRIDRAGKKETTAPVPTAAKEETLTPQLVAAVSAAIAEDLGTDVSGFRIVSFKKI